MAFCRRNMKVRTIIDPVTGARNDRTEYPIEAIREAVLNAVIHRDYSIYTEGTPVQIDFFTDRLEIHSPAACMAYDRRAAGYCQTGPPQPALAVMAEELTSAENRYSGIPTIRRAMAEYGLPEPVFENRRNEFVVILYNQSLTAAEIIFQQSGKNTEPDLLAFCKTPRSRQEIANYLGVKTVFYAMGHYVQPLLQSGQLAMTIPESPKSRKQKFYTV